VRLDAAQLFDTADTGSTVSVGDGGTHEREDVRLAFAHFHFGFVGDRSSAMAPACDTGQ
jgi:hypothetical protein